MPKSYTRGRPHIEEPDDDSGLELMVNVTDRPVTIQIDYGPNQRSHKITVQPGHGHHFDVGYCRKIKGAGRAFRPSIIEMLSMRADAEGVSRPCLVPADIAARDHGWVQPVDTRTEQIHDLTTEREQLLARIAELEAATVPTMGDDIPPLEDVPVDEPEEDPEPLAPEDDPADLLAATTPTPEPPPKADDKPKRPKRRQPRKGTKAAAEAQG